MKKKQSFFDSRLMNMVGLNDELPAFCFDRDELSMVEMKE